MEQSITTEVQSLRREIMTANEKRDATKRELDVQRQETTHWKEVGLHKTFRKKYSYLWLCV